MGVTLRALNTDKVASALSKIPALIQGGVKVVGGPIQYALIWEWGRVSCKPGPKTMWSTNPAGETRVLTKTAPFGYIRVNRQKYIEILNDEVSAIDWHNLENIPKLLEQAMDKASERCAQLVGQTAPIDTGALRSHIMFFPVKTSDKALQIESSSAFHLGTEW